MTIKDRLNNRITRYALKRLNAASMLTFESIKGVGGLKYQDQLIKGGYHDFWDNYSRKEVVLNDAIGERLTLGFLKHVFEKMPKFAENDEVVSEYIMEDVRDAIDTLQLKSKFIINGTNIVINGWSHVLWNPMLSKEGLINGLSAKIFGYEECHPRYWRRSTLPGPRNNKILYYRAIYVPRPVGLQALYHVLNEERFINNPQDPNFQHLTRIDYNYGFGFSRVQPIWDAITKLRERSDSDHFLNSNFMDIRYPQSWTKSGKGERYVALARKATRRRGLATEAVVNPTDNTDTGLPSVQYRPWGQGSQGQPMDKNKASAYLDGEWLRLLANLGYSQDWATGTSAGQQEGSELNLTRDDRADIAEFATLAEAFKKMLKRLAELGVMQAVGVSEESIQLLLSGKYVMQCWLTWEYNDKAALQQEQLDHEMEMQQGKESGKNAFNENSISPYILIDTKTQMKTLGFRTNVRIPMTDIGGGMEAGVDETDLLVRFPDYPGARQGFPRGGTYAYHLGDAFSALEAYTKVGVGGQSYVWSDLRGKTVGPAYLTGNPTPGGTSGSLVDYDISLGPSPTFEGTGPFAPPPVQIPEQPPPPQRPFQFEGAGGFDAEDITSFTPFEVSKDPGFQTATEPSVLTSGRVVDPSSITGTKKVGPGKKRKRGVKPQGGTSIVPYNPTIYNEKFKSILNSQAGLMRFAKAISTDHNPQGWSMRPETSYKIKELIYELANDVTRVNRVSYGNSIKAGHPYNYGGEDEFICPRDYKKNTGKTVPLGIYHNLDEKGNIELPEWQVVGTHEVLGWDDELGKEIAKNNYDIDKIDTFFKIRNERNWIWEDYLSKGIEPPISGAYTCNVKKINNVNYQVNINLKSMSFVPDANCPLDVCNFRVEEVTT